MWLFSHIASQLGRLSHNVGYCVLHNTHCTETSALTNRSRPCHLCKNYKARSHSRRSVHLLRRNLRASQSHNCFTTFTTQDSKNIPHNFVRISRDLFIILCWKHSWTVLLPKWKPFRKPPKVAPGYLHPDFAAPRLRLSFIPCILSMASDPSSLKIEF